MDSQLYGGVTVDIREQSTGVYPSHAGLDEVALASCECYYVEATICGAEKLWQRVRARSARETARRSEFGR